MEYRGNSYRGHVEYMDLHPGSVASYGLKRVPSKSCLHAAAVRIASWDGDVLASMLAEQAGADSRGTLLGDSAGFSMMGYQDWEGAKKGIVSRRMFAKLHVLVRPHGRIAAGLDGFEETYHRHNLVESAFSSIKARFGGTVRATSVSVVSRAGPQGILLRPGRREWGPCRGARVSGVCCGHPVRTPARPRHDGIRGPRQAGTAAHIRLSGAGSLQKTCCQIPITDNAMVRFTSWFTCFSNLDRFFQPTQALSNPGRLD